MTNPTTQPHGLDLINQVVNFYRQYLDCSSEQLDILALWTMHTHILPAAPFSPALNICSRQKQSGKTLCLQLLSLLCDHPWMHTAAAPTLLIHQLTDGYEPFPGTLLLDDCDATFGKSRINIKLQGLFTARFQQDAHFTVRIKDDGEYIFDDKPVFFPVAFAANGRLHPCLAERSISIALEPKKPGSACQPFRFYEAKNQSRSLESNLGDWGAANHERFEKIAPYKEAQFPPQLSWRHRDCAEPLLQVADFIGDDWLQRARQALVNAFALAAFEDFYSSRQILSDLREAFAEKGNPEWISTTELLEFLHTMDDRPWDTWSKDKPMQPKALAGLLEPFGVRPRNQRTGPKTVIKGYYLDDFQKSWACHPHQTYGTEACPRGVSRRPPGCDGSAVAADLQNSPTGISELQPVARSQQLPSSAVAAQSAQSINSEAGGPNPAHSVVAANLQNPSTGNSGQQLVHRTVNSLY